MVRQRPGAVADLPLDHQETSRTLRDQMLHGQPIIGGYIARRPAYDILGMSWYRVIDLFQQPDPTDIVSSDPATLAAMQCYAPIRHIIVRKDLIGAGSRRILKQTLASMTDQSVLRYEDERYLWYELPPLSDQCAPFLIIGSGWYDTEFDSERHWCWGSEQNDLWAVNPFNHSIVATISITGEAFNAKVPLEIWNQGHLLASWPIVREQRHYTWILTLLPGRNRLTLRLPTTRDPHSGRFLSFSAERMTISITGQPATRP
jgi:hypothetical protein